MFFENEGNEKAMLKYKKIKIYFEVLSSQTFFGLEDVFKTSSV